MTVITTKCTGESPDKTFICSGREVCWRYVKHESVPKDYAPFWKAGENCPNSVSVPKVGR